MLHHHNLSSDLSHASMWWVMMPFLSVIQPSRLRSSHSRATTCMTRKNEPSQSYPHTHGKRLFLTEAVCGALQQGFMVSPAHRTVLRISPLIKIPAAMGLDDNTNPITMVGISVGIVPHSSSKTSTSIALALSPEPLVQLSLLQSIFLIDICPATSIAI